MGNRSDPLKPAVDLEVRPSTDADAVLMAPNLRKADRDEIAAHSGAPPVESLVHGVRNSRNPQTVVFEGRPAAIFGVVPCGGSLSDTGLHEWPQKTPLIDGACWLLGTDDIPIFSRPFLRWSRYWLEQASEGFSCLGNIVDIRNHLHTRWLRWLDFSFIDNIRYGPEGRIFLRFIKEV